MKYLVSGRILPERADVFVTQVKHEIGEIGTITFVCKSSQITMTLDTHLNPSLDRLSAFILCKNHANIIISCLGYVKACNYIPELISITSENAETETYGVQVKELEEEETNPEFAKLMHLCSKDLFLRFVLLDFIRALTSEVELSFLCYRAIETIKSRFLNDLLIDNPKAGDNDAWKLMHNSIGTSRSEIDEIKKSADPIRHGNYYDFPSTNSSDRLQILTKTKSIITKYKLFLEQENGLIK